MKALFVADRPFNTDVVFDRYSKYNVDGLLEALVLAREKFAAFGIDLVAGDPSECANHQFEFILFANIPRQIPPNLDVQKSYLLLLETELILPWNWDKNLHSKFKRIFTWNDDVVDGVRYIKYNCSRSGEVEWVPFSSRSKLCTLIAGNKTCKHPYELYSLRKEFIYFFENKSDDFDFYGNGWNRFYFRGPKVVRALNRIGPLQRALGPRFKNYRGAAARKLDVLRNYKFSICFENGRNLPRGHITEKIFDSIAAGCIPVYYGAEDILDYVPEDCLVDYRRLGSPASVYEFISSMSEREFSRRLDVMRDYLASKSYEPFTPEHNSDVLVKTIVNDLEGCA